MSWSTLRVAAPRCDGALLGLAFVFLLLGYTAIASFAALQDGEAESRAPTLIAGSLPNVALLVALRLRLLLEANPDAMAPGPPLMGLGLLSLLVAGFGLWQARGLEKSVAVAGMGQTAIVIFAFGLGGATAIFAGILQMSVLTLARTAALQCAGHAARLQGGDAIPRRDGPILMQRPPSGLPNTLGPSAACFSVLPLWSLCRGWPGRAEPGRACVGRQKRTS